MKWQTSCKAVMPTSGVDAQMRGSLLLLVGCRSWFCEQELTSLLWLMLFKHGFRPSAKCVNLTHLLLDGKKEMPVVGKVLDSVGVSESDTEMFLSHATNGLGGLGLSLYFSEL